MKSASKAHNGLPEAQSSPQSVQRYQISSLGAAGVTGKVAIYERNAHGRMALVAALVYGASDDRPLAPRLAF
jgi:hypothetical protein